MWVLFVIFLKLKITRDIKQWKSCKYSRNIEFHTLSCVDTATLYLSILNDSCFRTIQSVAKVVLWSYKPSIHNIPILFCRSYFTSRTFTTYCTTTITYLSFLPLSPYFTGTNTLCCPGVSRAEKMEDKCLSHDWGQK